MLAKLLEERPPGQARPAARSLLALGDPTFQAAQANASVPPSERRRGPAPVPLPGTRKEVEAIAALFPQAEKLLGADASTARLAEMEARLQEFDVLHLATHGVADPAVAFHSCLLLASNAEKDGRLEAGVIRERWKLKAELVVLSACDSGLGRYAGGEGYLGFAQPLFLAGARSLVLSQWQVSDAATALLMVRFYENWLGQRGGQPMTKSAALREAKNWLRTLSRADVEQRLASLPESARGLKLEPADAANPKLQTDRPFEHPYYWSAFILIGDPN
jgi:CHAT domain-containing protein